MSFPAYLHPLNILVHVSTGSLAIVIGLFLLATTKGTSRHRVLGRLMLGIASLCVACALFGALAFRGQADLIGVSFLVAYIIYSGFRAIHLPRAGRGLCDIGPALLLFGGACVVSWLYGHGGNFHWAPAKVYGSLAGMWFYSGWDCLRIVFPAKWRTWLNPAEHAMKMTGLVGALVSVAVTTSLKTANPYVPLVVSSVFIVLSWLFAVRAGLRARRYALGVSPSLSRNARLNAESEL
jgi:uncharacterized membrane protein